MGNKKIVLTGGHAGTTAIAVVEEIIRRSQDGRFKTIIWIGPRSAVEGRRISTIEAGVFPRLGVSCYTVNAGKVQLKFTRWTIPSLLKIPWGLVESMLLLFRLKPAAILSFGGFAAFPVVLAAKLMRVPVVIHEQTSVAGRANRISSVFARKIALARVSSLRYFPAGKSVVTGNPVMTQILEVEVKLKPASLPVIYLTGGSRGARAINQIVEQALPRLLKNYYLIHHTGEANYERLLKIKSRLPKSLAGKYELYSTIDPLKIDNIYRQADIVIGRAGANTVGEIIATKRPAILIPLPYSYLDEQMANAKFAQTFGGVRIIKQAELTPARLLAEIDFLLKNYTPLVNKSLARTSPDLLASQKLVDLLEEVVL